WRKNKNRINNKQQRPLDPKIPSPPTSSATIESNPIQEKEVDKINNNNNNAIVNQQRPNDRKPIYGVAKSRSQRHLINNNGQNIIGGNGESSSSAAVAAAGKLYDVPQIGKFSKNFFTHYY
ncbi:hypothetical protein BLA29_012405, partial [Euroglyphus maynei]